MTIAAVCIIWIASAICITTYLVNRQNVRAAETKQRLENLNLPEELEIRKMTQENRKLELEIKRGQHS